MIRNAAVVNAIKEAYKQLPQLDAYLSASTIRILSQVDEFKTYDYFLRHTRGLVNGVYSGNIGGEFVDVFANLISGQLRDAYNRAWEADGNKLPLPDYLEASYQEATANQYSFVDAFYRDIVDARIDGTSIAPLLVRAELWSNRYNEATTEANRLMAEKNGGKLKWKLGATEQHCRTCAELNGKVAYGLEWSLAGLRPQGAKNDLLECGGWQCDCSLEPTDERKTTNSLNVLLSIAERRDGEK